MNGDVRFKLRKRPVKQVWVALDIAANHEMGRTSLRLFEVIVKFGRSLQMGFGFRAAY